MVPLAHVLVLVLATTDAPGQAPPQGLEVAIVAPRGEAGMRSVAAAVAAVRPGGRVILAPGAYQESVVIDKSLELVCETETQRVLLRSKTGAEPCLTIRSGRVLVRGIDFEGAGAVREGPPPSTVAVLGGEAAFEGCAFSGDQGRGLLVANPETRVTLRRCRVAKCLESGILARGRARLEVESTSFMLTEGPSLLVMTGAELSARDSTFETSKSEGIVLCSGSTGTLEQCRIGFAGTACVVVDDARVTARECRVKSAKLAGMLLTRGGEARVEDCEFSDAPNGLSLIGAGPSRWVGCRFRDSETGVLSSRTPLAQFERCSLMGNREQGMLIQASSPVLLDCVNARNGHVGVATEGDSNPYLQNCQISWNGRAGLEARPGSRPRVAGGEIADNGDAGVRARELTSARLDYVDILRNGAGGVVGHKGGEIVARRSRVEGNRGNGWTTDGRLVIHGGVVENNSGSGISLGMSATCEVEGASLNKNEDYGIQSEKARGILRNCDLTDNGKGPRDFPDGTPLTLEDVTETTAEQIAEKTEVAVDDVAPQSPDSQRATAERIRALGGLAFLDLMARETAIQGVDFDKNRRVTDDDLALLEGLSNLGVLVLRDTRVTDAGLAHLRGTPRLSHLFLDGTAITDASVDLLVGFRALEELHLARTAITTEGIARIRKALPKVKIHARDAGLNGDPDVPHGNGRNRRPGIPGLNAMLAPSLVALGVGSPLAPRDDQPPRLIRIEPDPSRPIPSTTRELVLTFDQPMKTEQAPSCRLPGGAMPLVPGEESLTFRGSKTCVARVALEPDTAYAFALESAGGETFVSTQGAELPTTWIHFETASAGAPQSETLVVGKGDGADHASIAAAIRAATPGARVVVRPGTYRESIVIDKPLTLEGATGPHEETVTIQAAGRPVIRVTARVATIRSLRIEEEAGTTEVGEAAALLHEAGTLVLERCQLASKSGPCLQVVGEKSQLKMRACLLIEGSSSGLALSEKAAADIEGSEVSAMTGVGIDVDTGARCAIRGTRVVGCGETGIYVANDATLTLERSEVSDCRGDGVGTESARGATLRNCLLQGNAKSGFFATDAAPALLGDCSISGNGFAGVDASRRARVGMRACRSFANDETGATFDEQAEGTLEDCDVHGNGQEGIYVATFAAPDVVGCRVFDNVGAGIAVMERGRGAFRACDIRDNSGPGVAVGEPSNPSFLTCLIHDNAEEGVSLGKDAAGLFDHCRIEGNGGFGVAVDTTNRPILRACLLRRNGTGGVSAAAAAVARIEGCLFSSNGESEDDDQQFDEAARVETSNEITQEAPGVRLPEPPAGKSGESR